MLLQLGRAVLGPLRRCPVPLVAAVRRVSDGGRGVSASGLMVLPGLGTSARWLGGCTTRAEGFAARVRTIAAAEKVLGLGQVKSLLPAWTALQSAAGSSAARKRLIPKSNGTYKFLASGCKHGMFKFSRKRNSLKKKAGILEPGDAMFRQIRHAMLRRTHTR